jgi:hypothetical protein
MNNNNNIIMSNDNNIINNDPIVVQKKKARDIPSYLCESNVFNAEGLRILNHYFKAIDAGSTEIDEQINECDSHDYFLLCDNK